MSVLSIGTGLFGLAWLVAIQGDRKQLGLPVWDGTVKSLVVMPPTPIHPSQAEYSATVRGHGYRIPPASAYASHVDSSSVTLASSSSRFDCNTFLLLLFLAMILLTALSTSLYLVHQYYVYEALEAQEIECSGEKRALRAEIARLEERRSDLQDDVRSELMEEQRSLCAKIDVLEEESAALQNEFRSRWREEKQSLCARIANLKEENVALQVKSQKRPYYPEIRDLELEISKWEDDFQRRVEEEVKNRVEYRIRELNSAREKNEDLRAENVKLKLIVDGGLPEGGRNPRDWTANVNTTSQTPTASSAQASPHWHQNVGDLQSVRRPPHTPASNSKQPPSSSTIYNPQREAPATNDPIVDLQPPFPDVASATTAIINAEKLALLKDWGVSAPQARKALRETDGDIVDAMQWARDHDDDLGNLAEYDEDDDSTRVAGVKSDTTESPIQSPSATPTDNGKSVADKIKVDEKPNDEAAGTSDTSSTSKVDVPSTTHLHHPLPPKPPTPAWLATPKADTASNPTSQGEKKDGDPAKPAQKAGQQSISDALPTTPPHLSSQPTPSHPLPTRIPALTNPLPRPATVPAKPVADGKKLHNPNSGRSEKDEQKIPSGQPTGIPTPTTNRPKVKSDMDVVPAPPKPVHALPARPQTAADTIGKSNKATAESKAKTSQPAPPPTSPPPPPPPPTAPQTKDDEACKGSSPTSGKAQAQESTSGANVIQPAPPTTTSTPPPPTPPAAPDTNDDAPPKAPPTAAAPTDPITSSADAEAQPTEDKKHDGGADEDENEEAGSPDGEKKKRKRRRKKRTGYARPMTAEEWGGRVEGGGEEGAPAGSEAKEWW